MKILGIFESQGSVDWGETSVDRRMNAEFLLCRGGWPIAVQAPKDIAPPTRHFGDTSIACRSLGVNPLDLMNDLESFGLYFRGFCCEGIETIPVWSATL